MALIRCTSCGRIISDMTAECPFCGNPHVTVRNTVTLHCRLDQCSWDGPMHITLDHTPVCTLHGDGETGRIVPSGEIAQVTVSSNVCRIGHTRPSPLQHTVDLALQFPPGKTHADVTLVGCNARTVEMEEYYRHSATGTGTRTYTKKAYEFIYDVQYS